MAGRDIAAKATDEITKELEEKLEKEYKRAAEELQKKYEEYMRRYAIKDEIKRKEVAAGTLTRDEYKYWRTGQILIGERWNEMANSIATDLTHTDMIARSIIHGYMPEIYALNHNYGTFEVEKGTWYDTSYTLYSRETVERLWRENPKLLPDPVPNSPTAKMLAEHEDMRWNRDHLQSELLQGILQGESIPQMADRMKNVVGMDYRAAVRNARTMSTGAMNAGRNDAYKRSVDMGIPTIKIWSCAHDGRTRESHLAIDGEECEVGKEFSNGCEFPGDPDGEPEEVYNCRCCMQCETKRSKHGEYMKELVDSYKQNGKFVSFDEWQELKASGVQEAIDVAEKVKETFADKINALRDEIIKADRDVTEDDFKKAGSYLREEYEAKKEEWDKTVGEKQKEIDELVALRDELREQREYWYPRRFDYSLTKEERDEASREFWKNLSEGQQLNAKISELQQSTVFSGKESAEWLSGKLSEIREVGIGDYNMKDHWRNPRASINGNIEYAYRHYPADWCERAFANGPISTGKVDRGWCAWSGRDVRISGWGDPKTDGFVSFTETAFHELGHKFEHDVPGIKDAEKEFYARRTAGEGLEWMGRGYGRDEKTRKDDFVHPYMGKEYGGRGYELVSMGFEYAYMEPAKLAKDQDMQEWIYGLLCLR